MIVLKILAAPFVVVLTVLAAVVSFLFCMATAVFVVACVVLTLLAVALFISGQTLGGIVFLVLAFLISPYGIPAIDILVCLYGRSYNIGRRKPINFYRR